MNGRFHMGFASAPASPQIGIRASPAMGEHEKYLADLLAERQKLSPFMSVLPNCSRLLNQEIVRVTSLVGASSRMEHDASAESPLSLPMRQPSQAPFETNPWAPTAAEPTNSYFLMQPGTPNSAPSPMRWTPQLDVAPVVKKTRRLEVPVDQYPDFNFVGRILGPRGNSLKRVEAQTSCRVLIRGRGSVKDSAKEEKLRDKGGFEHLKEPLHVIVEAELPENVIDHHLNRACDILEELMKPVDESLDVVKKAQLRELAMLKGGYKEDKGQIQSLYSSPTMDAAMKRVKTRR